MTDRRAQAPTIPEIKRMNLAELFTEAARVQGAIAKINTTLAFITDPVHRIKPQKALDAHERALTYLTSELAARYVVDTDARRAVLYRVVASVAVAADAYVSTVGSDKDTYYEQEFLLDQIRESLKALEELR